MSWSEAGCEVSSTNTTHTICHCYHLTSFAVLMSIKQDVSTLSVSIYISRPRFITEACINYSIYFFIVIVYNFFNFFRFNNF